MLRLLSIEYFKLKNSPFFWVLAGFFAIFLISVPIASKAFLNFVEAEGGNIVDKFAPGELPIFDFVDIWQNLTFIYSFFSIFLGFITVISVCNEYNYGTIKQNVIDGLSRKEFLSSKLLFILATSAIFSVIVLIIGLVMGYLWSPVKEYEFVVKNIEFIPAYFLHLVAFQSFCMLVSILIKRSGIVIAVLTFYIYVLEPIVTGIIEFKYKYELVANLFPRRALTNIIPFPFAKYILRETQTYVGWDDLGILLVYLGLILFLSYRIMVKRDLR